MIIWNENNIGSVGSGRRRSVATTDAILHPSPGSTIAKRALEIGLFVILPANVLALMVSRTMDHLQRPLVNAQPVIMPNTTVDLHKILLPDYMLDDLDVRDVPASITFAPTLALLVPTTMRMPTATVPALPHALVPTTTLVPRARGTGWRLVMDATILTTTTALVPAPTELRSKCHSPNGWILLLVILILVPTQDAGERNSRERPIALVVMVVPRVLSALVPGAPSALVQPSVVISWTSTKGCASRSKLSMMQLFG